MFQRYATEWIQSLCLREKSNSSLRETPCEDGGRLIRIDYCDDSCARYIYRTITFHFYVLHKRTICNTVIMAGKRTSAMHGFQFYTVAISLSFDPSWKCGGNGPASRVLSLHISQAPRSSEVGGYTPVPRATTYSAPCTTRAFSRPSQRTTTFSRLFGVGAHFQKDNVLPYKFYYNFGAKTPCDCSVFPYGESSFLVRSLNSVADLKLRRISARFQGCI